MDDWGSVLQLLRGNEDHALSSVELFRKFHPTLAPFQSLPNILKCLCSEFLISSNKFARRASGEIIFILVQHNRCSLIEKVADSASIGASFFNFSDFDLKKFLARDLDLEGKWNKQDSDSISNLSFFSNKELLSMRKTFAKNLFDVSNSFESAFNDIIDDNIANMIEESDFNSNIQSIPDEEEFEDISNCDWFSRIIYYLAQGMLSPRWQTRLGCGNGLLYILAGLFEIPFQDTENGVSSSQNKKTVIPKHILEDIFCTSLCVLAMDKFIDVDVASPGFDLLEPVSIAPIRDISSKILAIVLTYFGESSPHYHLAITMIYDMLISTNSWQVRFGGFLAIKHFIGTNMEDQQWVDLFQLLLDGISDSCYHIQRLCTYLLSQTFQKSIHICSFKSFCMKFKSIEVFESFLVDIENGIDILLGSVWPKSLIPSRDRALAMKFSLPILTQLRTMATSSIDINNSFPSILLLFQDVLFFIAEFSYFQSWNQCIDRSIISKCLEAIHCLFSQIVRKMCHYSTFECGLGSKYAGLLSSIENILMLHLIILRCNLAENLGYSIALIVDIVCLLEQFRELYSTVDLYAEDGCKLNKDASLSNIANKSSMLQRRVGFDFKAIFQIKRMALLSSYLVNSIYEERELLIFSDILCDYISGKQRSVVDLTSRRKRKANERDFSVSSSLIATWNQELIEMKPSTNERANIFMGNLLSSYFCAVLDYYLSKKSLQPHQYNNIDGSRHWQDLLLLCKDIESNLFVEGATGSCKSSTVEGIIRIVITLNSVERKSINWKYPTFLLLHYFLFVSDIDVEKRPKIVVRKKEAWENRLVFAEMLEKFPVDPSTTLDGMKCIWNSIEDIQLLSIEEEFHIFLLLDTVLEQSRRIEFWNHDTVSQYFLHIDYVTCSSITYIMEAIIVSILQNGCRRDARELMIVLVNFFDRPESLTLMTTSLLFFVRNWRILDEETFLYLVSHEYFVTLIHFLISNSSIVSDTNGTMEWISNCVSALITEILNQKKLSKISSQIQQEILESLSYHFQAQNQDNRRVHQIFLLFCEKIGRKLFSFPNLEICVPRFCQYLSLSLQQVNNSNTSGHCNDLAFKTFRTLISLAGDCISRRSTEPSSSLSSSSSQLQLRDDRASLLLQYVIAKNQVPNLVDNEDFKLYQESLESNSHFSWSSNHVISHNKKLSLRNYQWNAISWIVFLWKIGFHPLLADEMGLGKTIMALVAVAWMNISSCQENASLVICPASLLMNWKNEIERLFEPTFLKPYLFSELRENWDFVGNVIHDKRAIVIISVDQLRRERVLFRNTRDSSQRRSNILAQQWSCVVVDEAHLIRNPKSEIAGSIFELKGFYRLALSGTPVQNHVNELWSLFQFLNPGYLGDWKQFQKEVVSPIQSAIKLFNLYFPDQKGFFFENQKLDEKLKNRVEKGSQTEQDEELSYRKGQAFSKIAEGMNALHHLHAEVLPFICRRTKAEVLKDLPSKTVVDVMCTLSSVQLQMYQAFQSKFHLSDDLLASLLGKPLDSSKEIIRSSEEKLDIHPFQALRYSQLLAVHPLLLHYSPEIHGREGNNRIQLSGKFVVLCQLLIDSQLLDDKDCTVEFWTNLLGGDGPSLTNGHSSDHDTSDSNNFYKNDKNNKDNDDSDDDNDDNNAIQKKAVDSHRCRRNVSNKRKSSNKSEIKKKSKKTMESVCNNDDAIDDCLSDNTKSTISITSRSSCQTEERAVDGSSLNPIFRQRKGLIFFRHREALMLVKSLIFDSYLPHYPIAILDGSISPLERSRIISEFNDFPQSERIESPRILLLTTGTCSLGLNLTRADIAIFMEHNWNPSIDLQASDRIHRIGQKNPVYIYRLLAQDTIESRIRQVQNNKISLAEEILNESGNSDKSTQLWSSFSENSNKIKDVSKSDSSLDLDFEEESLNMDEFLRSLENRRNI